MDSDKDARFARSRASFDSPRICVSEKEREKEAIQSKHHAQCAHEMQQREEENTNTNLGTFALNQRSLACTLSNAFEAGTRGMRV